MQDSASLFDSTDTIAAIATVPGRSAIALIRVSGAQVESIGAQIVRPWPLVSRVATLCAVHSAETGGLLDNALVTIFRAPASFTGDDILEISTHGGLLTPALVLSEILKHGARAALPGEFTRRAVFNGRLDILQAEAIGDLIDASTQAVHQTAIAQLDGSLSRRITALRESVVSL